MTKLAALGFDGDSVIAIAILELLGAVLFLVRSTRSIGLLLVSAYMGGAVATHVSHSSSSVQAAFVLVLLWLLILAIRKSCGASGCRLDPPP